MLNTTDLLDELRKWQDAAPQQPGGAAPEGVYDVWARDYLAWQTRCAALRDLLGERLIDEALDAAEPSRLEEVYVVFDGPPGPTSGHFIETELEDGTGVGFTDEEDAPRWTDRPGGPYWTLGPFLVPSELVRRGQ